MNIIVKDVNEEEIGWERDITIQVDSQEYQVLLQWDKYNGFLLINNGGLDVQAYNHEFNEQLDKLSYEFIERNK